jgi:hypothetical protein
MDEDWRVTISFSSVSGRELHSSLRELEKDAKLELGRRVAISASDSRVFLYADTREAAEQAEAAVRSILGRDGLAGEIALDRWHPVEEKWEPADVPLPDTAAALDHEHQVLEAQDAADSKASGYAEWEVRIDLPSRHEAVELAGRLEGEGLVATRRWSFLVVGAADSDEAEALATRLRAEVPADARVSVQPGGEMVWDFVDPGWSG